MRIVIADNQPKVRQALRVLLEHQPGLEVVGEVADGAVLLARVKAARPDIVLLHWRLRGWSAVEPLPTLTRAPAAGSEQGSLRGLQKAFPGLAVIVLSEHPDVEEAALAAGADAFASKADPAEQLLEAIAGVQRDRNTAVGSAAAPADE